MRSNTPVTKYQFSKTTMVALNLVTSQKTNSGWRYINEARPKSVDSERIRIPQEAELALRVLNIPTTYSTGAN